MNRREKKKKKRTSNVPSEGGSCDGKSTGFRDSQSQVQTLGVSVAV